MKDYVTNFSRGCFHHWTASKAIMELVQNWLDSDGECSHCFGDNYLELTNSNIKVSNKLLMMGMSDKRDDDTKRGQFGVGSIQAMVVLTDLGMPVRIYNNDVMWQPDFKHCEKFGEDIMVIEEKPFNNGQNFTVIIEGLSEQDLDEVKQRCLTFQDREVLHSTSYGDVISNVDGSGEVFCGDIYVCQNDTFIYSYNFKPKVVKLSQDRDAVSQWDLQQLTSKLIAETKDDTFIEESIKSNASDTKRINSGWYDEPKTDSKVNDSFADEFLQEHGAKLVTDSYSEHQENIKLGNSSVYIENTVQVEAIKKSDLYLSAIEGVTLVERASFCDLLSELLDMVEEVVDTTGIEHPDLLNLMEDIKIRNENSDYN